MSRALRLQQMSSTAEPRPHFSGKLLANDQDDARHEFGLNEVKYRPEIDGLRAIAVAAVVLFHAELGFSGGFVGVDVFFVISGYLITSRILKEGEAFSLQDFWERRVRRIVPAAAVMTLASLVAGWFLFLPLDFASLGRSLVAQSLMVSNVYFWRDSGYFAADTVRPLLHTWSLAVEEQFYIGLPLSLYFLRRSGRRPVVWAVVVCALASFAMSVHGVRSHPLATFYLLPTRAWELLVGSLIAALPLLRMSGKRTNELLSAAGLLSILVAAIWYTASTPFPGERALLPCLGAAAIIVSSSSTPSLVSRFLSLRPLVWVGQISYSLYLWHWPIFTFARYQLGSFSPRLGLALSAFSCIVAWLSWKLIEQPIRSRRARVRRGPLLVAATLTFAGLLSAGAGIVQANGVTSRWPPEALKYAQAKFDSDFRNDLSVESAQKGQLVPLGVENDQQPIELLVWGDSHAMAVLHAVDLVCRQRGLRCLAATHSCTPPLLDFPAEGRFSLREEAVPFNRAIADFVRTRAVRRVLLAAHWPDIADTPRLRASFSRTVQMLTKAGATVFILKDVPMPGFDVPIMLAKAVAAHTDPRLLGTTRAEYAAQGQVVNTLIDRLAGASVVVLDPTPWFSAGSGPYLIEQDGHALYFDYHHLSTHGAMQLRPLFESIFPRRSLRIGSR